MNNLQNDLEPPRAIPKWLIAVAGLAIVAAGSRAYSNSLRVPFIFDDVYAIIDNTTIRSLRDISRVFRPPGEGATVDGRPILNLTFALNYAWTRDKVWSWHVVNIAIHLCAGLCLFGIVRRTLMCSQIPERQQRLSLPLAFAVALLWTLHPVETESVTYIAQRAESLAGLFLLLTMYCAIRAVQSSARLAWQIAAVVICLIGMGAKETMVAAPVLVVLYDWTFQGAGLVTTLKRRRWFYSALCSTWILLGILVLSSGGRGGTAGFGSGYSSWEYLRTQFCFILIYLKLCFWPVPLVLDYGTGISTNPVQYAPAGLVVALLAVGTVVALFRPKTRWLGYLGIWFFSILAPSSSIVPVFTQTGAEHRMYLPLAAVVTFAVLSVDYLWNRISGHWPLRRQLLPMLSGLAVVSLTLGVLTYRRNFDYRTEQSIWQDTAQKHPGNSRSQCNLGLACKSAGHFHEALQAFNRSIAVDQDDLVALEGRAETYLLLHQYPEAVRDMQRVVAVSPGRSASQSNLALALLTAGELEPALSAITKASRLVPSNPDWHRRRGSLLVRLGRHAEALDEFTAAIRLKSNWGDAFHERGCCYQELNRPAEAIADLSRAISRPSWELGAPLPFHGVWPIMTTAMHISDASVSSMGVRIHAKRPALPMIAGFGGEAGWVRVRSAEPVMTGKLHRQRGKEKANGWMDRWDGVQWDGLTELM